MNRNPWVFLWAVAFMVATIGGHLWLAGSPAQYKALPYEFQTEYITEIGFTRTLNERASKGWEYVGTAEVSRGQTVAIFRRVKL